MTYITSRPGNLSPYNCNFHHYSLTWEEMERKRCQEKKCEHLVRRKNKLGGGQDYRVKNRCKLSSCRAPLRKKTSTGYCVKHKHLAKFEEKKRRQNPGSGFKPGPGFTNLLQQPLAVQQKVSSEF
jgi:hypothetical protein